MNESHLKRDYFKRNNSLPTIIFQGRAISFRERVDTQNDAIFEAGDTIFQASFLVSMLNFGGGGVVTNPQRTNIIIPEKRRKLVFPTTLKWKHV